jgi:hypothetical protein
MREKPVCSQERMRNFCAIASFILKGMPQNHATKFAVREMLRKAVTYSCPEYKGGSSKRNVKYVSREAEKALRERSAVPEADHAIPIAALIKLVYERQMYELEELLRLVSDSKYSVTALVTKDEHEALTKAGLKTKMPPEWDGQTDLARYEHVRIQLKKVAEIPDFQALVARRMPGRLIPPPD